MSDRQAIIDSYDLSPASVDFMIVLAEQGSVKKMNKATTGLGPFDVDHHIDALRLKFQVESPSDLVEFARWIKSGIRPVFPEDDPPQTVIRCVKPPKGCHRTQQREAFPFWPLDQRCSECILDSQQSEKRALTEHQMRKKAKQFMRLTKDSKIKLPAMEDLLSEFLKLEGGWREMVKIWHDNLVTARESKPGAKYVLDHYRDFCRMMVELQRVKSEELNIGEMTQDEAEQWLVDLMLKHADASEADAIQQSFMTVDADEVAPSLPFTQPPQQQS